MITVQIQSKLSTTSFLKRRVKLEVPQGSTIADVLTLYASDPKLRQTLKGVPHVRVLLNGAQASKGSRVQDGDKITLYRRVLRMG